MKIEEALRVASKRLDRVSSRGYFEAQLLLCFVLKVDRTYLITHNQDEIDSDEFFKLVERRASFEPYEYITNSVSFYDIELYVEQGVLIPRPETEVLIDKASAIIESQDIQNIAEIGVGSGAISIVLARKYPHLNIIATDINPKAIEVAQRNLMRFDLEDRVTLRECSLLDCVDIKLDMVISNPPYIANDFELERNVVEYEPSEALFGGDSGDELLKEIIKTTKERDIRWLCCEMGFDQREPLLTFINNLGVYSVEFYKDLASLDRGFIIDFEGKDDEKKF